MDTRIGIVGSGKMAKAIAKGILGSGFVKHESILASDLDASARTVMETECRIRTTAQNKDIFDESDVVFLALYPHVILDMLRDSAPCISQKHLIISIAAGVSTSQILALIGEDKRVVRVMPNTPAIVQCGAAGFCLAGAANREDAQLVNDLLTSIGIAYELDEAQLNAVTGLSGSGPAFVFQFIEAMSDAGVRVGLPRNISSALAAQTILGAAQMVSTTGLHPAELKDQVASAGGTTIAGIHELEKAGFRGAVMNAVKAATDRSIELSKSS